MAESRLMACVVAGGSRGRMKLGLAAYVAAYGRECGIRPGLLNPIEDGEAGGQSAGRPAIATRDRRSRRSLRPPAYTAHSSAAGGRAIFAPGG